MAKTSTKVGSTSITRNIFIQDSTSTKGAGLTGLVYNSSGLTAYYTLPQAASVAISLATLAAATSAWATGGFKEIDATNEPGWYRFDIPNAALASGAFADFHFQGATNMVPLPFEIELTGWDNQDAVHGGMSALPNTACTTNGSLITSGSGTDQATVSGGIISADAKKINAVSTSSVTNVNANVGTTQPANFTGTGASALLKSDAVDLAGTAATTFITNAFTTNSAACLGIYNTFLPEGTQEDNFQQFWTNFTIDGTSPLAANVTQVLGIGSNVATFLGSSSALTRFDGLGNIKSDLESIKGNANIAISNGGIGTTQYLMVDSSTFSNLAQPHPVLAQLNGPTNADGSVLPTVGSGASQILLTAGTVIPSGGTVASVTGAVGSVTAPVTAGSATQAFLAEFATVNTGQTSAATFSVAGLSAGSGGTGTLGTVFNGMTSLPNWLRLMARNNTGDATALSELNAGGGTYAATADALQALAASGSNPWTVAANSATDPTTFGGLVANINLHTNLLTTGTTTFLISTPGVTPSGFSIVQGDDYLTADGRAVIVSVPSTPSLAGGTAVTWFTNLSSETIRYSCTTTFALNGSNYDLSINIPKVVTSLLIPGTNYRADVQVTLADGDRLTVAQGKTNILAAYPGS